MKNNDSRKPYDNRKVNPGEVLVPMMVSDKLINLMSDMDRSNIRTWQIAGRYFRVAFYSVEAEFVGEAMKQFNYDVNEFLGKRRDARCLLPQPDGSVKPCPKKNGDNHPDCAHCPDKGNYERVDKALESLDVLIDEFGHDPAPTTDDTNPIMLRMTYEDMLTYLADKPRTYDIVTIGFLIGSIDGNLAVGDHKELVKRVMDKYGLKKSQAYNIVKEAREEVKKYSRS